MAVLGGRGRESLWDGTIPDRGMVAVMTNSDDLEFADEVPVADAVEQIRPALQHTEDQLPDGSDRPLESNEADWQEQQETVEDFDEDFDEDEVR